MTRRAPSRDPTQASHLRVLWRGIDELRPLPDNPRIHPPKQVARLARSIAAFGFNVPLIVDGEGNVLAGHGRLLAARELGWQRVPTIALDHLDAAEARAFMIADNRLAEISAWDDRLLAEHLRELSLPELDLAIEATGFALDDIEMRIAAPCTARADPGAERPRRRRLRKTQAHVSRGGQVWRLGPHRVVCSIALDDDGADMLRRDEPAIVVVAEPAHADAIVRRWQGETGQTVHDLASGRSFAAQESAAAHG